MLRGHLSLPHSGPTWPAVGEKGGRGVLPPGHSRIGLLLPHPHHSRYHHTLRRQSLSMSGQGPGSAARRWVAPALAEDSLTRRPFSHGRIDIGSVARRTSSLLRLEAAKQLEQVTAAEFFENQPPSLYHSWRLSELVKLRRVYRAVLGATYLFNLPEPLYEPFTPANAKTGGAEPPLDEEELKQREEQKQQQAVSAIVGMYMTVEELQTSMQLLEPRYVELLQPVAGAKPQRQLEERVKEVTSQLLSRAAEETRRLPPEVEARLAAERDGSVDQLDPQAPLLDSEGMVGQSSGPLAAVVKGEQQLERYIVKKVAPFVKSRVEISLQNPGWVVDGAKALQTYGTGLWERLNGKGDSTTVKPSELGLPGLVTMKNEVDKQVEKLLIEIDSLEKKVQTASKSRESRVRRAGLQSKARLAVELMAMDREVIDMSHTLGIRTLQLEMLYMYQTLEQEALEISEFSKAAPQVVAGLSPAEELAIYVAEYGLLNTQLNELMNECQDGCCLIEQSEVKQLENLSREIPDLRSRLGIGDGLVFGGGGFSLRRIQMTAKDSLGKIAEGVGFLITGFRVLGSDVSNSFKLLLKAARGRTLRPREVQALRRSVLDLLAIIPFTIILIIPLSPIGHVLVFGFIQRYFPGLYPSQFTARRQEIMKRYEELKEELLDAQKQIEIESENEELARAKEAVARLMSPMASRRDAGQDSPDDDKPSTPPRIKDLEAKVAAAKKDTLGLTDSA